MGLFKKTMSESEKQLWAIGLMGHHLKSRSSEVTAALAGPIGAGIVFASPPSIVVSSGEAWRKANGSHMAVRGLTAEEKANAVADYNSQRHVSAKKELLEVLIKKSAVGHHIVLAPLARELVVPELPEDFDWTDVDSSVRELSHFASDCLRDAFDSYTANNGKYGSTAYEFVLKAICYAGSVLRV
jgi:hypothetical protein